MYVGPGGAGNFVKMVHNGIEYGDMQLISEAYDILKTVGAIIFPIFFLDFFLQVSFLRDFCFVFLFFFSSYLLLTPFPIVPQPPQPPLHTHSNFTQAASPTTSSLWPSPSGTRASSSPS